MRAPIVCLSPAGNLWLLLEAYDYWGKTRWLNLETGEVRWQDRPLRGLLSWGWRIVEGDTVMEAL